MSPYAGHDSEPRYVLFDAYVESSTSFYRILQDSDMICVRFSGYCLI